MTWVERFDALERGPVGAAIRESLWLFPAIEAVHLLGLALLGGAVLMVDLRLVGAGLTERTPAQAVADARPWLLCAIAVMFATGVPLFLSEAVKCFYNFSFWVKMTTLPVALAFTFLVKHPLAQRDLARPAAAALGLVSIALWFTVAAAGRWIGFSG